MKLYQDHLRNEQMGPMLERVADMHANGLRPEVNTTRVHPSESKDYAYLVQRVSVLDEPFNPETTDEATDRVEVLMCSCSDFYFNRSDGVDTRERKPSEMQVCKHCYREFRTEKAQADDKQETL